MNPNTNRFEPLDKVAAKLGGKLTRDDHKFTEKLIERATKLEDRATLVRADGSPVPEHWPIFKVGEDVVVKGYVFRIGYIGETTLLLEPVRMAP